MAKAAGLDTVLPGTKKKGDPAAAAMNTIARSWRSRSTFAFEGTRDIQTKVMTTLFALFAEVERDLISERTREGLARARASGKKLGRPKGALGVSRLDGKEDDIADILPVMPVGRFGLDAGSGATGVLVNTRREAAELEVTWRLPHAVRPTLSSASADAPASGSCCPGC